MADTPIALTLLDKRTVSYRQAQMPFYMTGSFVGDDTDYHVFKVDGGGKDFTCACDNATNRTVTITVYGMHSATAEVGETGVCAITDAGFTVTTKTTGYGTNGAAFPYYLIRAKFADVADDKTVTMYINFQPGGIAPCGWGL